MTDTIQSAAAVTILVAFGAAGIALSDKPATSSAPIPRVARLTDEQCLGYGREYLRLAVYVSLTVQADRTVDYEYAGIQSAVNEATHDLSQGYRLVPIREIPRVDWFAVWSRAAGDPITDSRLRALYSGKVSDLPMATARSLGVRCDEGGRKRRVVR